MGVVTSRGPAALHVIALLPPELLKHLRASLGPDVVIACDTLERLVTTVGVSGSVIVAVDPSLCPPAREFPRELSETLGASVVIVLYTQPSMRSARICFAWGCAGVSRLVLSGIDDSPGELCDAFDAAGKKVDDGEPLVECLQHPLTLVPSPLAMAIRRLFSDHSTTVDRDALVGMACMSRRSVDRWLARTGIASLGRLLGAARLLRAHRAVGLGGSTLERAAAMAGFSSERSLALHMRTLLGETPSALRRLSTPEISERLANVLCGCPSLPRQRSRRIGAKSSECGAEVRKTVAKVSVGAPSNGDKVLAMECA